MTLGIQLSFDAKKEVRQANCWHEAERAGRGTDFLNAVDGQLLEIAERPDAWPLIGKTARQSPVFGWDSYSIIYEIHDDHVYVLSVFHASREPKDW